MKSAIIAALPRELKGLVNGWEQVAVTRPGVNLYTRGEILAACAGVGVERASLAVETVLAQATGGSVDELISFGLAGACDPALRAGEVLWCGSVVDARSGERFSSTDAGALLVTSSTIASVAEKQRLYASYGAALVDMEASAVARIARAHGIGFRALKAVSDTAEEAMDSFDRFVTKTGQFREGAFALHVALRPAHWRAAIRLGRASAAGLKTGTAELLRAMSVDQGNGRR